MAKGLVVTSGYALSCVHFSTAFQSDSKCRYLGDQKIGGRDTYVVFAQQPGKSGIAVTMKGSRGTTVRMLTQGLVWVDKKNFHIRRMRMDLLARQPEIGLDEQTTRVNFSEVHLPDLSTPLWLPRDFSVSAKFRGADDANLLSLQFENLHHYTHYRRYRVSTKMVTPK